MNERTFCMETFCYNIITLPYTRNELCIVTSPGTIFCTPYKYLLRAGIEPAAFSAAVDTSATVPTCRLTYQTYSIRTRIENSMKGIGPKA